MFVALDYFREKIEAVITMGNLLNYKFVEDNNINDTRFDFYYDERISAIFYNLPKIVYGVGTFDTVVSVDNPKKEDVDKLIELIKDCVVS